MAVGVHHLFSWTKLQIFKVFLFQVTRLLFG